ncbi:hypothetical protein [Methanobrevibacter arboriphilus]|uniref:Uncharacterized protein n=1 Tax=Methanobrevibacter arboriphilus TaxID=39441 RepID=A0ACA8R4J8_METAZ|nr:hypothetical protein [Methanobrevibacter arboriphilus]BBL62404.1 hypothetical protein MarbSA_14440 [Methanobrevibacter arboriphilus]
MNVFDDLRLESESKRITTILNGLKDYKDFRDKQAYNLGEFLTRSLKV